MNITPKPRVRPDVMGFTCYGCGVEGHGMTVDAAYASWKQRRERQQLRESSEQLLAEARRDYPHLHDLAPSRELHETL